MVLKGLVPGGSLMVTFGPTLSISQPADAAGPTLPAASVGVTDSVWMPLLVAACVCVDPGVPALQGNATPASTRQMKVSFVSPVNVMSGAPATSTGPVGTFWNVTAGGAVRSTVQANAVGWLARAPGRGAARGQVWGRAARPA